MNHRQLVQFAAMCIAELDEQGGRSLSLQQLSRNQGIPFPVCRKIIRRLDLAGIVKVTDGKIVLLRSAEEMTALDVLEAIWSSKEALPAFRMVVGGQGVKMRTTLDYIRRAQLNRAEESING